MDLPRLQAGDEAEWNLHFDTLNSIVRKAIAQRVGHIVPLDEIEQASLEVLEKFIRKGISQCRRAENIIPYLRRAAHWRASDLVKQIIRRAEEAFPDDEDQPDFGQSLLGHPESGRFGDNWEDFLNWLVTAAKLSEIEKALVCEHIINQVTQQQFAAMHLLSLGSVGGIKHRALRKLRDFADSRHFSRQEIF
jgi:DNA-directed RNA polymerase specialized sigma24 family protein